MDAYQKFAKPIQPRYLHKVGDSRERTDLSLFQKSIHLIGKEGILGRIKLSRHCTGEKLIGSVVSMY
jgi:hypothetical protein